MPRVLLVTETADLAADLLVLRAAERGIPLYRLNLDEFPGGVAIDWSNADGVRFAYDGQCFGAADVAGAWFRRMPRPSAPAGFVARESAAFLAGVLETAPWPWINAPSAAARAEHKLLQLREAASVGLDVPPTRAGNDPAAARRLAARHPIVAKPVAGGRMVIDGVPQAAFTRAVDAADLADDAALQAAPTLFQQRIATAFDLRVTVIRQHVFAARIGIADRSDADVDWRAAAPERVRTEACTLPPDLAARCIALLARLQLGYGALDFVATAAGQVWFLEINPAGQWGWIERATGLPITDAILDALHEGAA